MKILYPGYDSRMNPKYLGLTKGCGNCVGNVMRFVELGRESEMLFLHLYCRSILELFL